MSLLKRLTLGVGIIALGVCGSLPFRRPVPAAPTVVADAAANQLSLGAGVSLQMPGQQMTVPLETKAPAPWAVERDAEQPPAAELATDPELAAQTTPPALPDQYRPLFKPAQAADKAGRVVGLDGQVPPRSKPLKKHTIHDGDTLESLAVRYLGDAQLAADILAANPDVLADPQLLPIGVAIVIPTGATAVRKPAVEEAVSEDAPRLVPLPTDGFRRGS